MTTIIKQISAGTDDGEEKDDSITELANAYMYIGVSASSHVYDAGLRWQSVDIPRTALIVSAKLSLYSLWGTGTMVANIRGIAEDNPLTWSQSSRPSQRAKTTATVQANTADWNNWGDDQWGDINITSIVQEIIDRDGWTANNALAVVIEDASAVINHLESVRTYDYTGHLLGAKLEITYTTSPSCSIVITDLDGTPHTITDDVRRLEITTMLSDASDSFSMELLNEDDEYSYVEKGCAIAISIGMGSTTKKLDGYITEASKTLDRYILPIISMSGESGEIRLNHIFFSKRFYDNEISALVKAILDATDYTTGETYRTLADIDASNTHIESTAYSVDEATYVWKSLGAAIKDLADMVGFAWFRDTDKKLHFFDPAGASIAATIVDADLEGSPIITDVGEIVNRAVVIGGYQQTEDKSGNTKTTTTTVTDSVAKNQSFVPTEDYLSSVLVYTELVASSASSITISIQSDSVAAPDGVHLSNGQKIVKLDSITDAGYTEFRFDNHVTLTPGDTYWIVLEGTTSDGVKVGINGGAVLDYETRYPVRVAVMSNDDASQDKYGMYMEVFKDDKIEDSQLAEIKANEMLMPEPKKVASLTLRDGTLKAGDVVQLTISETGITIDKTMKILSSTKTLGDRFIYNGIEMEEI